MGGDQECTLYSTGSKVLRIGVSGKGKCVSNLALMSLPRQKEPESNCTKDERGGFPESATLVTIPVEPSANCSDSVANFTTSLLSFFRFYFFILSPHCLFPSSPSLKRTHACTHTHTHTLPAWRALSMRLGNRWIWLAKICATWNQKDQRKRNGVSHVFFIFSARICFR